MNGRYLFSVDVEDLRDALPCGDRFPARIPELTGRYLEFLRRTGGHGTFFFVGKVARRHPELVQAIVAQGHEIGCHSDTHLPLEQSSSLEFRDDLLRNLDALHSAGAVQVLGYRAPCFSLTNKTRWAYNVLADLGFIYSSSVLPARNPLYGWSGFGSVPRLVHGVLELPVSLLPPPLPPVPIGGVYFRVVPRALIRFALSKWLGTRQPVISYHHPHDIDCEQPFPDPGFSRWSALGLMMRAGRSRVLPRLEMMARMGFQFESYGGYAERELRQQTPRRRQDG